MAKAVKSCSNLSWWAVATPCTGWVCDNYADATFTDVVPKGFFYHDMLRYVLLFF